MTDDGNRARTGLNAPTALPAQYPAGALADMGAEELTRHLNGALASAGLASHPYGGLSGSLRASHAHAPYVELCGAVSVERAAWLIGLLERGPRPADSDHAVAAAGAR